MLSKSQPMGSVYRIKAHQTKQVKLYAELPCLKSTERDFLLSILELAIIALVDKETAGHVDITRTDLQAWMKEKGLGSSQTTIKKHSRALTYLTLFDRSSFKREKQKPADLFTLQETTSVIDAPEYKNIYSEHRSVRKQTNAIKTTLIESEAQVLDGSSVVLARSERLWNGVLGAAMRTSRTAKCDRTISTIYTIHNDKVEIVTSADSNSEICHVDDQRTIRAIITMVCLEIYDRINTGRQVENNFYIDLVSLCELVGLGGGGANRDTLRASMDRLYNTNFKIKLDPTREMGRKFAEQFGLTYGADDLNFRFLTEMDSSVDREFGGAAVRKPRWYRVSLHSKTFQDLTNESVINTYVDNKEILKINSGLIHIFYTWCSINVKRSGSRVLTKTIRELNYRMISHEPYRNFKQRFLSAIAQYCKSQGAEWNDIEPNTFNLLGYIVTVTRDANVDYVFKVYRDTKDPVIGNGSKHNELLLLPGKNKKKPVYVSQKELNFG